jgi:hypothetical protein
MYGWYKYILQEDLQGLELRMNDSLCAQESLAEIETEGILGRRKWCV